MESITNDYQKGDKKACQAFYGKIGFVLQMEVVDFSPRCGQRWGATLQDSEGRRMHLSPAWQKGDRLQVGGDWPTSSKGGYMASSTNPQITVSIKREPEAIAKDIQRRFLPDFHEHWTTIAQQAQKADDYVNAQQSIRARLVSLIAGAQVSSNSEERVWCPGAYYHELRTNDQEVSIELCYMPLELAENVVAVVEQWRKDHPDED